MSRSHGPHAGWKASQGAGVLVLALAMATSNPSAQQRDRYTLNGQQVAIHNLVGELRVEPGTGPAVIVEVVRGGKDVMKKEHVEPRTVARPDTTFLVTNMMRSVLNEGTGAGARGQGFALDAAGKTGTTNDLRDAWFVGFTPELLTVVWVGFDDNQPVGLSGAQAALPIWTQFMRNALAGRASVPFDVPGGISFIDIDPVSGKLATPLCLKSFKEAFLAGSEPTEVCDLHR